MSGALMTSLKYLRLGSSDASKVSPFLTDLELLGGRRLGTKFPIQSGLTTQSIQWDSYQNLARR